MFQKIHTFLPRNSAPHNPYQLNSKQQIYTNDRRFVLVGIIVVSVFFLGSHYYWKSASYHTNFTSLDETGDVTNGLVNTEKHLRLRVSTVHVEEQATLSNSQLKVMTFNLRFNGMNDGLNGWNYRKDHVADIINRYHPVLLGTQEGLKTQLAELEELLKHSYKRFGVEREENGEFEQIFYDTEVLERVDNGDFWLSDTPDTPESLGWDAACVRLVTWGKFRLRATQQELFFFNTQLDHVGMMSREKGSKLLWKRMQQIAGDAPLFLVGDFNTYRHTNTYSYYTSQESGPQLHEAWPEAAKQIGNVSFTYHGWAGVLNDGEKNAVRAANHIDWIFYRPQMTVLTTEVITENRNGRYPSDHYPIQAEVSFPNPA